MTNEKKKVLLIVLILVSIFSVVAVGTYLILHDDNKLDVKEKEWIADNTNNVQNVYVVNDIDILAKNGSGVIFDFLDMLKKEYSLDINPITYNSGEQVGDRAFKLTTEVAKNQTEIYKEHYVLISKSLNSIESLKQLNNINVGVVINDEKSVNNYLNGANIVIKSYETPTKLFEALELSQDITYAIVPLEENLSSILTSNYYIDYHISDLNKYLVYEQKEGDLFSSIVSKYFAKFKDDELLKQIFFPIAYVTEERNKEILPKIIAKANIEKSSVETFTNKSLEWEYEQEWRIIIPKNSEKNSYIVQKDNKTYVKFLTPKSVYLGYKIDDRDAYFIKKLCEIRDIPVYRMIKDNSSFNLTYIPYE